MVHSWGSICQVAEGGWGLLCALLLEGGGCLEAGLCQVCWIVGVQMRNSVCVGGGTGGYDWEKATRGAGGGPKGGGVLVNSVDLTQERVIHVAPRHIRTVWHSRMTACGVVGVVPWDVHDVSVWTVCTAAVATCGICSFFLNITCEAMPSH